MVPEGIILHYKWSFFRSLIWGTELSCVEQRFNAKRFNPKMYGRECLCCLPG
jgi:hypothetical protein